MSKRLRTLLPVPEQSTGPPAPSTASSTSLSDGVGKRKRVGNQLACNTCRKRKTRCDGRRPQCDACRRRRDSEPCVYEEPRQTISGEALAQSLELLDLLKTAPDSQVYDILRTYRLTSDLAKTLHLVKSSKSHGKELAGHGDAHTSLWQLGLPFELMTRNPMVYRPPWHLDSDAATAMFGSGSEVRDEGDGSNSSSTPVDTSRLNTRDIILTNSRPSTNWSPKPSLCDSRLRELDVACWSSLSIPNMLAAEIISLYLQTDHPLLGTFDPDLFVEDLVHGGTQFCSKFLFHAVMYWGCQMYSTLDSQASSFVTPCAEAAEELWATEKDHDHHLNLASIQLLGMAYMGDGKDHHVLRFVAEADKMATRMGLISVNPATSSRSENDMSENERNATSYAAWGTFNWLVLMSFFYQQPGLSYPHYAPTLPIPRFPEDGRNDNSELSERPSRHYMGDTFSTLCQFWKIIHEVTLRYYRDNPTPRKQLTGDAHLVFAEFKYRELLAWSETLPGSMMQTEDSPHHVIIFHAWFHAAVLDILRPFTAKARGSQKLLRLKTFSAKRSSVDAAFKASVSQLKRLIITFRSKYTCSAYTMLWHTALIYVANAILQNSEKKKDPTWHFYLLFCIHCYETLRQSYRFAEATGRGLLSMTLQTGDMSADEARRVMKQLHEKGVGKASSSIRATFMVDLSLGMTDPEQASVESLASQFEDVALFQEFINQNMQDEDYSMDSDET